MYKHSGADGSEDGDDDLDDLFPDVFLHVDTIFSLISFFKVTQIPQIFTEKPFGMFLLFRQ